MPSSEEQRIVEFERLNLLGKFVYLAGAAVHTSAHAIDVALDRAVDLVLEAERAFKEGRDNTIEDAKVLKEWEKDR